MDATRTARPVSEGGSMSTQGKSRRSFLIESVSGLGGVWVAANYPAILAAKQFVL